MANWDFCSICNSGEHCCRHDNCNCVDNRQLYERYSSKQLFEQAKLAKKQEQKEKARNKKQEEKEIKIKIQKLNKELRKLKAKKS